MRELEPLEPLAPMEPRPRIGPEPMRPLFIDQRIPDPRRCRWNIVEVPELLLAIERPMKQLGYVVALYGSVSKYGMGRDLDLMIVPWRKEPEPATVAAHTLARALGGVIFKHPVEGYYQDGHLRGLGNGVTLHTTSVLVQMPNGRLIDACFREQL